jgi:hypothetical protein
MQYKVSEETRLQFEHYCAEHGIELARYEGGTYFSANTRKLWLIWQNAVKAHELAKVGVPV